MTTWICDNCGYECELPEGIAPVSCPECGGVEFKQKPPAPPGGPKKPTGD